MISNQVVRFSTYRTRPRAASAPWWTGSPATVAPGVSAVGNGAVIDTVGKLQLSPSSNLVRSGDPSTWNKHGGGAYQPGTPGAWGSGDGVELRAAADLGGVPAWEMRTAGDVIGLAILDPAETAEQSAGTAIWLVVHGVRLTGTGDTVRFAIVDQDGGNWDGWEFQPAANNGHARGVDSPLVEAPTTAEDWSIEEIEAGVYRLTAKFTVASGQTLPAGWFATFGPGNDSESESLIFTRPMVVVDEPPAPDFWVPAGAARGDHVEVADAVAGGFPAAAGAVLRFTARRPVRDGTIAEIVGDNADGAGQLVVRLRIVGGAPQLWVSDTGGTSSRTGTAAADDWPSSREVEIAVEVGDDEVVLFVDGYAVTGAVLTRAPTALTAYRLGAEAGGANGTGARIEDARIADRAEASWARTLRKLATAEVSTYDLPGRLVVEV
jgi:hypothetical protein